ncbi:tetratricopeptide repeat protein [Leeuwenhoekiella sp. A16]|uniref:tetratricopeptide repeat-containing sensor histidine kinase n=1 Tax=unclassified Leeuwenhoekiella TaxID=2615029 RepID=UPI003A7FC504
MKANAYSFLFFILIFISTENYGQNIKEADSLRYYYNTLSKPTDFADFQKAKTFFEKRVKSSLYSRDTLSAIQNLRLIANGQSEYGLLNDSEQTVVFALRFAENISSDKKADLKLGLNNQLGMIYRRLNDYEKALSFYDRALSFSQSKKDSISILNNKSTIYKDLKQYESAEEILKETLKIASTENTKQYARILSNLGYVQFKLGDKDALNSIQVALAYRIKENDLVGQYSSYNDLAEYYIESQDFRQARVYFDMGYAIAKKINSAEYLVNSLGKYVILDQDPMIIKFKKLKDSLEEARLIKENKYAAMKYDVEKEQQHTQIAQLEGERQKTLKTIYLSLAVLGVCISVPTIALMHQKRKRRQLESIHQTEAFISKRIHDGLANDTFQVMSELQNLNVPEHILKKLDKIYLETRDISKNHSPLIEGSNFPDQLISRLNSYKSEHLNVITRDLNAINWSTISQTKKNTIYMVLGELMTNNKKHSHANLALISFDQNRKKLKITYKDNGSGEEIKKGNGIQNMESRIHALNGTIIFDPELGKGLTVQIQV